MSVNPVIIGAYYGTRHQEFFGPWLESLVLSGHREIILGVDQESERLLPSFNGLSVTVTRVDEDPLFQSYIALGVTQEHARRLAKFFAWRRALQLLPKGGEFVALDIDTLVCQHLGDAWLAASPNIFHLAAPRHTVLGRTQYRGAVLCGIVSQSVFGALDILATDGLQIARTPAKLEHYGSPESGALVLLQAKAEEGLGIVFGSLPISWCTEAPVFDGAHVIHFHSRLPWNGDLSEKWKTIKTRWRVLKARYEGRLA